MARTPSLTHDAHRHIGRLPAYGFYGGPPISPDTTARATVKEFFADLDAEGTVVATTRGAYQLRRLS